MVAASASLACSGDNSAETQTDATSATTGESEASDSQTGSSAGPQTATDDPTGATTDDPSAGSVDPTEQPTTDPTDPTDPPDPDPSQTTDPQTTDPDPTTTTEGDSDVDTDNTSTEGTTDTGETETDSETETETDSDTGVPACQDELPNPAGQEVVIAPEFEEFYTTYDLGPVPGMPQGALLGGCTIHHEDENTLLIAGESEQPSGKIYRIGVVRGPCGNIIGWDGLAEPLVDAPYVDANLAYGPQSILFYTHWPTNQVSQLLPGAMMAWNTTDMQPLGVNEDQGVSGLGFVPPNFNDPAGLRVMTWAGGHWYHVGYMPDGEGYSLHDPTKIVSLPNGPGGFAYVPEGSPGFDSPHIIVSDWSTNTVSVYEADGLGDPMVETRKDFYTTFPRPWGAYFEPLKGDFMFLTWGAGEDRVYITQGFEQPPPTPQ